MLIHIHDNALRRVAFLDNEKPGTLHYYNDSWHRYLTEATSTFDFTVPKSNHEALPFLTDKSYISFRHKHRDYLFSVMRIEETEQELTCFCENLNLELLNESAAKFEAPHAMSFAEYFNDSTQIGGAKYTDLEIGINEVSGYRRQLTWEGTETKLARLLSLVGRFDAECEFDTKLNRDGTLKHIVLNVYKKHDDTHQGVGARRQDVTLFYGKEVRGIRRTIDKTELYSAIQPIGKDGLTIGDLNKQELNDDGRVAFVTYYGDPNIYAPITAEDYPPQFASKDDPWILYRWEYDTDNVNVLYGQALAKLKTLCEPAMTYEVDGHFDLDVGDTVTIHDDKFVPTLLLEARVSEQEVCFSDPSRNKTKFSNFKALESKTSVDIFSRISAILESHKSYRLELSSTDGTVFKNGEGSTTLAASVKDGVKDATATFTIDWYKDGVQVGTGKSLTVAATQIDGKSVIRYDASDADAVLIGSYEVTLTNVQDGEPGLPGEPGTPGEPGKPGEKGNDGVGIAAVTSEYYLSTSKTAQVDGFWSLVMPMWETGKYLWIRTKVTYTDDNVIYTEPYSDSGWEAAQAVDNKLGSYATISDMNTNIQNSEESILATASATYATKADVTLIDGKFLNYSTTIQMNSAINQKANEINQSVSAVQITANNALNTANAAQTGVTDVNNNLTNNYSTTVQMHSAISQKADSITQSVSETYATKTSLAGLTTRVSTAESKLTPTALTTTISSALGGTDSITTTKFVMDKDGLLIRNGGLTIQNNVGQAVMTTDVDGNLTFRGDFKMSSFQSMTFEDDGGLVTGRMSFLLTGHLGTDGQWYADYGIYTTTDFSLQYNAKRYISFSAGKGSQQMLRIIGREANNNIEAILGSNTTHVYYSKINGVENLYLAGNVSVTGTLNMGMGWATYGGRRVPRFHAGSKVVNANGQDYAVLLTLAELQTSFNAPGAAATSMAVFVSNGDGTANHAHAEAATYLNGNWYVTFNKGVQGVRINYLAIYWG